MTKLASPIADVWQLFAEQEFDAGDWRGAEIGDRTGLLFAGDANRGHHRRDQDQHQHDRAGNGLVNAFERLIVAEALLDIDRQGLELREVALAA